MSQVTIVTIHEPSYTGLPYCVVGYNDPESPDYIESFADLDEAIEAYLRCDCLIRELEHFVDRPEQKH